MPCAELMLDLAAYKQALQQARQALQAPWQNQPLSPGCLAKNRSSGWYPGLGRPLLDAPPVAIAPLASSSQSLNHGGNSPSPLAEGLPPQVPALPPGRLVSSSSPGPTQPPSLHRIPPWDSSPSSPAKPPASVLAMISLLETMAPYSNQVPDSDLDSLWSLVTQTYSKRH